MGMDAPAPAWTMWTCLLVAACLCGSLSPVHGIVGGHDTAIEKFPYQVSVEINGAHHCGGSILNEAWILSSAACVSAANHTASLGVRAGSSGREAGGSVHRVGSVSLHPGFGDSARAKLFDAALLHLTQPLTFSPAVTPVTLAPSGDKGPDLSQQLIVTGWGATDPDNATSYAEVLQAARIPALPRSTCGLVYSKQDYRQAIMLCAGVSGKDWCNRDRGAPLLRERSRTQVGIASWATVAHCGLAGFPSVYTNVGSKVIRSWIKKLSGV